jgi:hypothetical protein
MKRKYVLLIALVFVSIGGLSSLHYSQKDIKSESQLSASEAKLFQPEAQMYARATDPRAESLHPTSGTTSLLDEPMTKRTDVLPYVYDKNTCAGVSYSCLTPYYKKLVSDYGVRTAFLDIKKRYTDNADVASMCHPLTHIIGQEASRAYANVSEAYLRGDSFCWSGYYHGIMEGFVDRIGIKNLPAQLMTMCADIPSKKTYGFDYYNCVHGLGHGIMEKLSDDVILSLAMCDNLTGSWERESCYGGVFMENIINDNKNHNSKYLKPEDPLYPCTAVQTKYRAACYLGQSSYALQVTDYNFSKIFKMCNSVETPFRDICNQSLGRDAASVALHTADKTKATCALASDASGRSNCVIGAVKEFISYYHSDTQAKDFCALLDGDDRTTCEITATTYYKQF